MASLKDDGQGPPNALANRNGYPRSVELSPANLLSVSPAERGAPAISPIALLKALRRRWPIALILGIIAGCAASAGVWKFLPPAKQIAYSRLYLPARPTGVLAEHPEAHIDFAAFQKTQMSLIKSGPVVNGVLKKPSIIEAQPSVLRLAEHPSEWLAANIKVDFADGPEIARISLECINANEAKVIVDAVTSLYLEKFVDSQMAIRKTNLEDLQSLQDGWQKELNKIDDAIRNIGERAGALDPHNIAFLQQFKELSLHNAESEYFKVKSELRTAEVSLRLLKARTNDGDREVSDAELEEFIDLNSAVLAQLKLISDLEHKLKGVLSEAVQGEADPTVSTLKARLKKEQANLPKVREEIRPLVTETVRRRHARESKRDIDRLEIQIAALQESEKKLKLEMEAFETKAERLNVDGAELAREQAKHEQVAKVVNRIADKILNLSVEMKDPPRVSLLEEATIVHVADRPRRLMFSFGAGVAALAAILLGISFLEFHSRRLDSVDEVVHGLGITVMGTLPRNSRRAQAIATNGAIHGQTSHTLFADSIDSVRTMLVHAAQSGSVRIVMITSAVSGEGKTFLATHLAVSLARAGYKTLLIDGDLRSPIVHRVFDLPPGPGLSEVLRGEAAVGQTLRAGPVPDLWVMPAGRLDLAAIRALVRDRLRAVLDGLRSDFDCILVDSSPILRVSDSLSIAKCVDGVLFAVMRNVSRLPRVQAAYSKLYMLGVRVLGAVVNGTTTDEQSYGYDPQYDAAVVS
jgi:capsular exopolysaccharide synthesis family protein